MVTAGDITVDGAEYGRTDWREVRKRVGLVTSTLTFYLEPGEPVLDAVVSGREAMLNLVGQVSGTADLNKTGGPEARGSAAEAFGH